MVRLDLNGCNLTLSSLDNDPYVNSTSGSDGLSGAVIIDNSDINTTGGPGVTLLTLDNASGCSFSGDVSDDPSGGHPAVRIIKTARRVRGLWFLRHQHQRWP